MADDLYDEDDQYGEGEGEGQKPDRSNAEWATLRKERKERAAAEERAAAAERQLAFISAGINPNDPRAAYFVKGYDGEMTVEAITEAAREGGFIEQPSTQRSAQDDEARRQSLAASQRIAAASAGGSLDVPASTEALDKAYLEGGSEAVLREAERMGITVVREQ